MDENEIATAVIGSAIEVHRALGPGLLESAYHECLVHEFRLRKIAYEREVPLAVEYKGMVVDHAYRIDLLVVGKVLIELKSVDRVEPIHRAQLLTYLRLARRKLGLVINFNATVLKDGVHRVVNKL
jgi:GxxExxY protein